MKLKQIKINNSDALSHQEAGAVALKFISNSELSTVSGVFSTKNESGLDIIGNQLEYGIYCDNINQSVGIGTAPIGSGTTLYIRPKSELNAGAGTIRILGRNDDNTYIKITADDENGNSSINLYINGNPSSVTTFGNNGVFINGDSYLYFKSFPYSGPDQATAGAPAGYVWVNTTDNTLRLGV